MVYVNYEIEEWLEDFPEEMKKIPPLEESIDRIPINCRSQSLSIWIVGILGGFSLTWGAHARMYQDMNIQTKLFLTAVVAAVCFFDAYIGREEKGFIAIYPEMMVFYWYDKTQKRVRAQGYRYWKDVMQYSKRENAIWFGSIDNRPYCPQFRMKKLRPYLEKYAPQAKVVTFDVQTYLDKERKKRWKKEDAEYNRLMKERRAKERAALKEARKQAKEQRKKEAEEKNKKKD